jgi:hypothetical protein
LAFDPNFGIFLFDLTIPSSRTLGWAIGCPRSEWIHGKLALVASRPTCGERRVAQLFYGFVRATCLEAHGMAPLHRPQIPVNFVLFSDLERSRRNFAFGRSSEDASASRQNRGEPASFTAALRSIPSRHSMNASRAATPLQPAVLELQTCLPSRIGNCACPP